MSNSIYELRSNDAQEILRKPPRVFIARGNLIILLTLVVGFYFLNTIPLYKRETVYCEVIQAAEINNSNDSAIIALSLKLNVPDNIKANQSAKLYIGKKQFSNADFLLGSIVGIRYKSSEAPILFFKCRGKGFKAQAGKIGNIEIITKKETLLSMLLGRFKF